MTDSLAVGSPARAASGKAIGHVMLTRKPLMSLQVQRSACAGPFGRRASSGENAAIEFSLQRTRPTRPREVPLVTRHAASSVGATGHAGLAHGTRCRVQSGLLSRISGRAPMLSEAMPVEPSFGAHRGALRLRWTFSAMLRARAMPFCRSWTKASSSHPQSRAHCMVASCSQEGGGSAAAHQSAILSFDFFAILLRACCS